LTVGFRLYVSQLKVGNKEGNADSSCYCEKSSLKEGKSLLKDAESCYKTAFS
jgi:hypothetical protein